MKILTFIKDISIYKYEFLEGGKTCSGGVGGETHPQPTQNGVLPPTH